MKLSVGPTRFIGTINDPGLVPVDIFSLVSDALPDVIVNLSPQKVTSLVTQLQQVLRDNMPVLFTLKSLLRAVNLESHPPLTLSLLLSMARESNFVFDAENPSSKAFGLLQILPSNVRNIASGKFDDTGVVLSRLSALRDWPSPVKKAISERTLPLLKLNEVEPIWQVPFVSVLFTDLYDVIYRNFKFTTEGVTPSSKVVNKRLLATLNSNRVLFSDPDVAFHFLFTVGWADGYPKAFFQKEPTLHYMTNRINLPLASARLFAVLRNEPSLMHSVSSLTS